MANSKDGEKIEDLERGSEEVPLSTAKFVLSGNIALDLKSQYSSINKYSIPQITSLVKLERDKLLFLSKDTCFESSFYTNRHHDYEYLVGITSTVKANPKVLVSKLIWCPQKTQYRHVAVISKEKVIFSRDNCLDVVNVNGMQTVREIKAHNCYDISCVDNKVVFVYEKGVGIWNVSGSNFPLVTVKLAGLNPENDFKSHRVSAVMENGQGVAYVYGKPSLGSDLVTKISLNGDIINNFNNLEFKDANAICATGDGHLFMSFLKEQCIRVLLPDMSKAVRVIEKVYPSGMCYCPETRRLFVGYNSQNPCIQVFEIQ